MQINLFAAPRHPAANPAKHPQEAHRIRKVSKPPTAALRIVAGSEEQQNECATAASTNKIPPHTHPSPLGREPSAADRGRKRRNFLSD